MPGRILSKMCDLAADPDVRRFIRHAAVRPSTWRLNRPDRRSREPDYLKGAATVDLKSLALPALVWREEGFPVAFLTDLRLAAATLRQVRIEALPWRQNFDDLEDEAALHRFAWLLPWMLDRWRDGASRSGVWTSIRGSMRDWIAKHPDPDSSEAWQAYSVSERLMNWIVAAISCGSFPLDEELRASIVDQAQHLRANLEFYGPELTGNHLSNNGRALYWSGAAAGRADLAGDGRAILIGEAERLFSQEGFLREGSAHYQLLVTRNYLECLWLAEHLEDRPALDVLREVVPRLRRAAAFFLVEDGEKGRTPAIGDLSPDCPPEWLFGVVVPGAPGWGELFFDSVRETERAHSTSEWGRVDAFEWTLFTHANAGTPGAWHSHHDTGGVVVFHQGDPVLLDCGRSHYVNDRRGTFGRDCWSHSLLTVDGVNPEPRDHWFFTSDFVNMIRGERPELSVSEASLAVAHSGYERRKGVGRYRRDMLLEPGQVVITDSIEGTGMHRVSLLFHLPGGTLRNGAVEFATGSGTMRLQLPPDLHDVRAVASSREMTFGWSVPRYGDLVPALSVIAEGRVRLPWRGKSTICLLS